MNDLHHELATGLIADMQVAIPSEQGVATWCEKDTLDEERPSDEPMESPDQLAIDERRQLSGRRRPASARRPLQLPLELMRRFEIHCGAIGGCSGRAVRIRWAIDRDELSPSDLLEGDNVGAGLETGSGREPTVAEFEWSNSSSFDVEAEPQEESLNTAGDVDAWNSPAASISESTTCEGSPDEQVETADSGSGWDERIGEQLESNACENVVGNDESNQELFQDAATTDDQVEPSEEAAAFAEFSIWNQGTREQHLSTSEPEFESEETAETAPDWGDESSDVISGGLCRPKSRRRQ